MNRNKLIYTIKQLEAFSVAFFFSFRFLGSFSKPLRSQGVEHKVVLGPGGFQGVPELHLVWALLKSGSTLSGGYRG